MVYKFRTNVIKMMDKGIFRKAKWYEVVKRYPPLAPPGNRGKPPRIVLEEDSLYNELYQRIPQLQYTPLRVGDSLYGNRNVCDKFVYFQKLYMDSKGMTKEDAFNTVQKELDGELKDAVRQSSSLYWNGTLGQSEVATELIQETSYNYMKMEERKANLLAKQYSFASKKVDSQISASAAESSETMKLENNDSKKDIE
ncbi:hypothetical protein Gasu2_01870 [Galdieria sulphuraria]|uniref:Small ribosomal subunit protein mS23 n=1 Tax=Galdieria sulphuraria TaxID=130081 RepID=M2Y9Y7_GALSU|nr:uncharacterized protein Gasu_02190 [Galdieria sulphuraria]EME32868.1 hypothetical protein Gasu_02190 [Galdieria sulphuraria]GJD05733.1 hypothetical protein Gasu2_01870 [Galdieria sulphuraria]|eukprot:XP_005709388.1 hypothetical protein Gasu_02190 [Galdieria sulphuraria]